MKYVALIISLSLLLSCRPFPSSFYGKPWDHRDTGLVFDSVESLSMWMFVNLTYVSDMDNYGQEEFWASPYETLTRRSGDCEDYVIFAMYHLQKMGYTTYLVGGDTYANEGHAVIEFGGVCFEGDLGSRATPLSTVLYRCNYEQVIDVAERSKR